VAWEVTDLFWQPGKPGHGYDSTFNLLVREIRGVDITFDEIELFFDRQGPFYPYQRRVTGEWRLTAYDQFRIPLGSVVSPFLLGRITLSGHDSQSQPVKAAIELALLDYPPSPPEKTSMSVRAITLTPPATR